eukprot:Pgem_evm1s13848
MIGLSKFQLLFVCGLVYCTQGFDVKLRVFIHNSVISGQPWTSQSKSQVTTTLSKTRGLIDDAFAAPTFPETKVYFKYEYSFISDSDIVLSNSATLLEAMRKFGDYAQANNKLIGVDLGYLLTTNAAGFPGEGGYSPLGPQTNACGGNAHLACGNGVDLGWFGLIARHELGHYFGAPHDTEGDAKYCPQEGDIMGGNTKKTWSYCSTRLMGQWLKNQMTCGFGRDRSGGNRPSTVSCGRHSRNTCSECPFTDKGVNNGRNWCNGDCQWINGQCSQKGGNRNEPKPIPNTVSCGNHNRNTCAECPFTDKGVNNGA